MIKEDSEDFENALKCWVCDNVYVEGDAKVRNRGKYRGSAHADCNMNVKSNHKTPIAFHKLTDYDSNIIMQELGKFNFKISAILNGLEK